LRHHEPDMIFNGKPVPFSAHGDASDLNANKGRRVQIVKDFIGFLTPCHKCLDIGAPNAFSKAVIDWAKFDNTDCNLHEEVIAPSDNYDLVMHSEVIEHLFSPGMTLRRCYELLKPGGILIVSTPIPNWTNIFQSPHHLAEYKPKRFRTMLEYYGFEVLDYKKICIWDRSFMFKGPRPLFRVLFHRSQLWKLKKPY